MSWEDGARRPISEGWRLPSFSVGCLLVVFLLAALVFVGFGFLVHLLWILAVVFFVCWLAGYAFARGRWRGTGRRW